MFRQIGGPPWRRVFPLRVNAFFDGSNCICDPLTLGGKQCGASHHCYGLVAGLEDVTGQTLGY
jgi:hypothetical protein